MPGQSLYDTDFYSWTQEQARLLREVRDNRLDADHLAEEVADLGRSELRAVNSHLTEALKHLIKLAVSPSDEPRGAWRSEVRQHLDDAQQAFSPGMRQVVDLGRLWDKAVARANDELSDHGEPSIARTAVCPFGLDELLSDTFDPRGGVERIQGHRAEPGDGG